MAGTVAIGKGDTTGSTANHAKSAAHSASSDRPSRLEAASGSSEALLGASVAREPARPRTSRGM